MATTTRKSFTNAISNSYFVDDIYIMRVTDSMYDFIRILYLETLSLIISFSLSPLSPPLATFLSLPHHETQNNMRSPISLSLSLSFSAMNHPFLTQNNHHRSPLPPTFYILKYIEHFSFMLMSVNLIL